MALVFNGIRRIDSVGGGMLKAYWNEATGGTVDFYNLYIRNGDPSVFGSSFLLCKIKPTILNSLIRMESDSVSFLRNNNTYYIGVKAEESGIEYGSTQVMSSTPLGDGSIPLEIKEILIQKII